MRIKIYRALLRPVFRRMRPATANDRIENHPNWPQIIRFPRRMWFHGASVGELENLRQIIDELIGNNSNKDLFIIISAFSRSALKVFPGLEQELNRKIPGQFCLGLSPIEGEWEETLRFAKPQLFVTSKYETWPDLWISLSRFEIPLMIMGARMRSSLRWARRIQYVLGRPLPPLYFFVDRAESFDELQRIFSNAKCCEYKDPRWDRVKARSEKSVDRAELIKSWIDEHSGNQKIAVFGSFWMSDLRVLDQMLQSRSELNIVVPHEVDPESIVDLRKSFEALGWEVILSSRLKKPKTSRFCLIVDEMGVLVNLYATANWAYVGGGFGKGVHSTIEPAIYGVPILCGPSGITKFEEIEQLRSWNQLKVIELDLGAMEASRWIDRSMEDPSSAQTWAKSLDQKLGGAQELAKFIRTF